MQTGLAGIAIRGCCFQPGSPSVLVKQSVLLLYNIVYCIGGGGVVAGLPGGGGMVTQGYVELRLS